MRSGLFAVLVCAMLAGCGKPAGKTEPAPQPPASAPAPAKPSAPVAATSAPPAAAAVAPAPAAAPLPPPEPKPAVAASDFQGRMQEVEAAERETDFVTAIRLCEAMVKDFTGPDQLQTLGDTLRRLNEARNSANKMAFAVQKLGSSELQSRQAGGWVLEEAGELGSIYLRHAFRTKDAAIAREAGQLLIKTVDTNAVPIFCDLLKRDPRSPLADVATQGILLMLYSLDRSLLNACLEAVLADKAYGTAGLVDVLEAVHVQECKAQEQAFNEAVGHPDGLNSLRGHFGNALLSTNPAVVAWACRRNPDMLPLWGGFRVRYYPNTEIKDAAVDRMEAAVRLELSRAPLPDGRRNDFSARWISDVRVFRPGVHTVRFQAAGRAPRTIQAWMDGRLVCDIPSGEMSRDFALTLEEGWHTFQIDYVMRGRVESNEGDFGVAWEGPKTGGASDAGVVFMHRPWPEEIAALNQAIASLGAKEYRTVKAAGRRLADAGSIGRQFLFRAIETQTGAVLQQATDELREGVRWIEPGRFPDLYNRAVAAGAEPVNPYVAILCSALWQTCNSDPEAFNRLVGAPDGYAKVKARIESALVSSDKALVTRACRNGFPFAPEIPGLYARYYADPDFGALGAERPDTRIDVGKPNYPLPPNQQGRVSAEWSGWLVVEKAVTNVFWPDVRGQAGFSVRGAGVEWGRPMVLTPGRHPVRGEFRQADANAESYMRFNWDVRGAGRVSVGPFACAPWDGRLAELGRAAGDLASGDAARMRAARAVLRESAGVGRVYLHHEIRHGAPAAAAAAARFLAELQDRPSVAPALARFTAEKDASVQAAFADALCAMAAEIDPKAMPDLYRTAVAQGAAAMNPHARILCAALVACGGSQEAFNKLVNDPNGYAALQKHVQAALAPASSPQAVRNACRYGTPFAPALQGFIGLYYWGQDFNHLAVELLDPQVNVPNRRFPYPDGRQDNISVRWTALLRIEKPGDYTFIVNSHGEAHVWVDDRHVASSVGWDERKKDVVPLSPGLHRVRVDMRQGGGNNEVRLQWIPPGGNRDWIPSGLLMSVPSEALLAGVEKALAGLSSSKPEEVGASAEVLKRHGAFSLFLLRRAIDAAQPAAVAAYVPVVVEMRDHSLADRLRELRKTRPPLAAAIDAALEALAAKPDRRYGPWFYAVMKADGALEFPVSGRFLSKALQEVCGNDVQRFNNEFAGGDGQGAVSLKAYLGRRPGEKKP